MVLRCKLLAFNLSLQLRVRKHFINFEVQRFVSSLLVRPKSNMADESEPLTFNSRSKSPYDKFSNFYEVKLEMPEGVFGSVEHYFQAMKFIDRNHSRFEVDGDMGKRRFESGSWKETVVKARFIKSAGGKSGTAKHKLTLRSDGLDRERAKQKMEEGLRKKFEVEPFRSLLLETRERELIHIPMRGKTDYWTGRVDKNNGNITGENNMGKLLMKVRELLQKAENKGKKDAIENVQDDKKEPDSKIKRKKMKPKGENKGDDEDTSLEAKDNSGNEGKKRKHEDDDVQVSTEEEPEGPAENKRRKIEMKSKDENKDDDGEPSREAKDSLGCEGIKGKH